MKFRGLLLVTIISALLFESHGAEVCETDDCKAVANEFKKGMNESVDPCTNFWEFTCGSFEQNHQLAPWETHWSRVAIFQQMIHNQTRAILEEDVHPDDILPVRQAKKWYRSCMDIETLDKHRTTLLETIWAQVGGWPMTLDREEWDEDAYTWQQVEDFYLLITGSYTFYKIGVSQTNPSALTLERGDIPLAEVFPTWYRVPGTEEFSYYEIFITTIAAHEAERIGVNVTTQMAQEDTLSLLAMEKLLIEVEDDEQTTTLPLDDFVALYNRRTEGMVTKLDIRKLFQGVFDLVSYQQEGSFDVETNSLKYLVELTKVLNRTPKRTLINYIHWHFVSGMVSATEEDLRYVLAFLVQVAYGIDDRGPRWLECVKEVKMSRALAYAYAQKYYSGETEDKAREMIEAIRSQMRKQIENSSWLDAKTKAVAVEKLSKMGVYLGVPDWFKNRTNIINSYKGLIIDNNHFNNVLSSRKFEIKRKLRRRFLNEDHDFEEDVNFMEINAFYTPDTNNIYLPAANFQKPFFTESVPNYVNFGTAGVFIGHEMGHGFDSNGIKIGLNGEEMKIEKEVMDKYFDRAECFLKQYNNYAGETDTKPASSSPSSSSVKSYGRRTLGENIADNAGFQTVFGSYKNFVNKIGEEKKLPGFEKYTDEQMFFITYGALWCDITRPKYLQALLRNGIHSTGNFRVIGAASNSKDFAKAFSCSKGSNMNPHTKCAIWEDNE